MSGRAHELGKLLAKGNAVTDRRNRLEQILSGRAHTPMLHECVDVEWLASEIEGRSPEFLWRGLVRAHTTVQGVATYERFKKFETQSPWNFAILEQMTSAARETRISRLVSECTAPDNPRFMRIMQAFNSIKTSRCLENRQKYIRALRTVEEKVSYFDPPDRPKPFVGFGPKYARNFWLDIGDPQVSSCHFAIDSRIQKILALIWPVFGREEEKKRLKAALANRASYSIVEHALLAIARGAGVNAWRADRLMFTMGSDHANDIDYFAYIETGKRVQASSKVKLPTSQCRV